jgi:hypothetical protein
MKRSRLDQLVAAEREHAPRPEKERAQASWKKLQRSLAAGAVAPFDLPPATVAPAVGSATWLGGTLKVLAVAAVTAGGVTVAVQAGREEVPARVGLPTPPNAGAPEHPAAAPAREDASRVVAPAPSARRQVPPQAAAAMPDPVVPDPVAPDPAPDVAPRVRARPKAESKAAPEGIGRELQLVAAASDAVKRGEHREALAILKTHARDFASGALREDREALRVIALCGLGRTGEGTRAAEAFAERFPSSVHTERAFEACSTPEKKTP